MTDSRNLSPEVVAAIGEGLSMLVGAFDDALRADLRAKVEALPTVGGVTMPYVKGAEHRYELIYRDDVLALLDGSSDD